jgi:hypothetical protein
MVEANVRPSEKDIETFANGKIALVKPDGAGQLAVR